MNTAQVEVAFAASPSEFNSVAFSLNTDGVPQEANETFSIQLVLAAGNMRPTGSGVFFLDTLDVTIIDNDGKLCC